MGMKDQIFEELNDLESAVVRLSESEAASKKQTDLEIAILRQQIEKSNDARMAANEKIENSLAVLGALE